MAKRGTRLARKPVRRRMTVTTNFAVQKVTAKEKKLPDGFMGNHHRIEKPPENPRLQGEGADRSRPSLYNEKGRGRRRKKKKQGGGRRHGKIRAGRSRKVVLAVHRKSDYVKGGEDPQEETTKAQPAEHCEGKGSSGR